jgi:hypothetical protein
MPLKIEMSPESVRPVVVCDGCGEPIADARDGNYQWRGGSGAWYAMELTELLPHVASGLNINWDEATRYAGLSVES